MLVLLPGMDGTGELFAPLIRALPSDITPVVVSYPPETPLSYQQLLPLVKEGFPKEGPFVVLGESFSGPLAVLAASENPRNLAGVILCATFITNPIPWLPWWVRFLAVTPVFYLARSFILAKALIGGYGSPEILALLRKAHGKVSPKVMATRARAILAVDVGSALKKIDTPIFFIGGADDKVSPPKNLDEIVRARNDVHVSLIPGPHLILQTKPVETAALISKMVDESIGREEE